MRRTARAPYRRVRLTSNVGRHETAASMRPVRTLPSDIDDQVGWFHDLAAALQADGDTVFDAKLRASLNTFIGAHLPEHAWPEGMDDNELADAIGQLRENESSWNRALQSAIIAADDRFREGNPARALKVLTDFAATCPWKFFAQIALDQSTHYAP